MMIMLKGGVLLNILENVVTEMSPTEFEVYCLELLESIKSKHLKCSIEHNQIYRIGDENYQLDGVIEFEELGVKYKTVVECKKYKSRIKRSQIQILNDTIKNVGANKGIFISTSSYQKGAMEYAKKNGIALLQIVDGVIETIQNSCYTSNRKSIDRPKYIFAVYDLDLKYPCGFLKRDKYNAFMRGINGIAY